MWPCQHGDMNSVLSGDLCQLWGTARVILSHGWPLCGCHHNPQGCHPPTHPPCLHSRRCSERLSALFAQSREAGMKALLQPSPGLFCTFKASGAP